MRGRVEHKTGEKFHVLRKLDVEIQEIPRHHFHGPISLRVLELSLVELTQLLFVFFYVLGIVIWIADEVKNILD